MFGLSFGELVVVVVVAIVVIGPRDLPRMMRKLGQAAAKLRRMLSEVRAQSGIDEVLRGEGIAEDIQELRRLARGELDHVVAATRIDGRAGDARPAAPEIVVSREREYPIEGPDNFGALPAAATVYDGALAASEFADDPVFTCSERLAHVAEPAPAAASAGLSEPGERA